jgi:WD40 repeat protein
MDKTVKVWNPNDGTLLMSLEKHEMEVNCAKFSYNGKYIISGSSDNTVILWDVESK